jgi:hypothetical protein
VHITLSPLICGDEVTWVLLLLLLFCYYYDSSLGVGGVVWVFENVVLGTIFGRKREGGTGRWRKWRD